MHRTSFDRTPPVRLDAVLEHAAPRASSAEKLPARSNALAAMRTSAEAERWTLAEMSGICARRWGDAPALYDARGSSTFAELHRAVLKLTTALKRRGVCKGDRVVLLGSKEADTVVAMLATSRAGATCVPIDPALPPNRLAFVLDDAAPRLVLGKQAFAALSLDREFMSLDDEEWKQVAGTTLELAPDERADCVTVERTDVAYIMYTSGSTGYPKGVLIEHHSIEAFFQAHNARVGIEAGDRCMNTGPFHFDVSIMDVFLPLYFGASVVLTPELPMPKLLLSLIERHRITHFYAVGTILALMTGDGRWLDRHDLSSLRVLQTGAEVCNPRVVNEWLRRLPALGFVNSYGPTELTVGCVCYRKSQPGLLPEGDVPIGLVHDGSQALLLDKEGKSIREPNCVGELLVSGAQVMRGFWNRPQEEASAFRVINGVRHYRTGDLAFFDDEGLLHYVGRGDHQVKVDGCRIHLNEVKRCLEAHPTVASAVAGTLVGRHNRLRIGAAISSHGIFDVRSAERLFEHLRRELPTPAVPIALLVCSSLPRTPTGKTDLRRCMEALQSALRSSTERCFVLVGDELSPLSPETTHIPA